MTVRVPPAARDIADRAARQIALPRGYLRLRQAVSKPNSSLADLSKVVVSDERMGQRLLTLAGSGIFGRAREIDSAAQAVSLLGVAQVHDFALADACVETFGDLEPSDLDVDAFWRRSVYCALLARALGARLGGDGERLFVVGLLADIGQLVVPAVAPDSLRNAFTQIPPWHSDSVARQDAELGYHHAQVAAALLDVWSMDKSHVDWIARQNDPTLGGPMPDQLCVVHIAVRVADGYIRGDSFDDVFECISRDALQDCGLGHDELFEHYEHAASLVDAGRGVMFAQSEAYA